MNRPRCVPGLPMRIVLNAGKHRADMFFGLYLLLVLIMLVYVVVEPEQAADLVRAVGDWMQWVAEILARSLPKPVPAP